jgi:hypothetical protein
MEPVKFEGHERELGAPPDWDPETQGQCVGLPVQRMAGAWVSVWRPTQEEYARLCAGGDVCLSVFSHGHPAVGLSVSDGSGPIPGEAIPERPVLGDRLHAGYNAGVTVALNILFRAGLIDLKQCEHVLTGLGVFGSEVLRTAEDPVVVEVKVDVPELKDCDTCKHEYADMGSRCVECMVPQGNPGWEARSPEDRDCYTCKYESHNETGMCGDCEAKNLWAAKDA